MARFPRHSVPTPLWRIPAGPVAEAPCWAIPTTPARVRSTILPGAPQATVKPHHLTPPLSLRRQLFRTIRNPSAGGLIILRLKLESHEPPPGIQARNGGTAAAHAVVQHQLPRVRIGSHQIFQQGYRLLGGVIPFFRSVGKSQDRAGIVGIFLHTCFPQVLIHGTATLTSPHDGSIEPNQSLRMIRRLTSIKHQNQLVRPQRLSMTVCKADRCVFFPNQVISEQFPGTVDQVRCKGLRRKQHQRTARLEDSSVLLPQWFKGNYGIPGTICTPIGQVAQYQVYGSGFHPGHSNQAVRIVKSNVFAYGLRVLNPPFSQSSVPNLPWGKNLLRRGACGLTPLRPNFFWPGGGVQGSAAPARPSRPCAQAFRRSSPPASTQSISLLPHFSHRLATVAGMAKALKIAAIHEHCPVSAMRLDVIHFRGRCPDSVPSTLPAKRLTKELAGPQVFPPLWCQVHPVPGLGLVAAVILWAVAVAVAAGDQGRTPRMPAWAQRLLCHGLSPPGKTKSLRQHVRPLRIMWHRLYGTGTRRYLRWTLSRRACSTPSSSWLWSLD